jgi:HAMP domain-containing protein
MTALRLRRSGRRAGVAVIVLVAGLLPLSLCAALMLYQSSRAAQAREAQGARQKAEVAAAQLDQLFVQWRSEILIAASNQVVRRWYTEPGRRDELADDLNHVLVQFHDLYPDLIDEACYIGRAGPEQARMVKGIVAATADLSPDESGNPFFAPTFALTVGHVHQHGPYISPDSKRWVISNSTPVYVAGKQVAVLHFEASLEGVRQRLIRTLNHGERVQVVDANTGLVVIDTGAGPIADAKLLPAAGRVLHGAIGRAAVPAAADNQNHWSVAVAVPATAALSAADARNLSILAVLTLLGLLLLARWTTRRMVRPIARMTDIARQLAAGDLTQRIELDREDEVGKLAAALNQAVATLDDTMGQVAIQTDELARYAAELRRVSTDLASGAQTAESRARGVLDEAQRVAGEVDTMVAGTQMVRTGVSDIAGRAGRASDVAHSRSAERQQRRDHRDARRHFRHRPANQPARPQRQHRGRPGRRRRQGLRHCRRRGQGPGKQDGPSDGTDQRHHRLHPPRRLRRRGSRRRHPPSHHGCPRHPGRDHARRRRPAHGDRRDRRQCRECRAWHPHHRRAHHHADRVGPDHHDRRHEDQRSRRPPHHHGRTPARGSATLPLRTHQPIGSQQTPIRPGRHTGRRAVSAAPAVHLNRSVYRPGFGRGAVDLSVVPAGRTRP